MKIEGRTFVISGGASGLGAATAAELCAAGGRVAVLDRDDEAGRALASSLQQQHRKVRPDTTTSTTTTTSSVSGGPGDDEAARFFPCDVLDPESVAAAVRGAAAWARETGCPLGGVVPAAGVSTPATILDRKGEPFSLEDFDFVMGVNVRGTVDLVRHCLKHMAQAEVADADADGERGVVVMVASSAAFDGQKGQVSYAASKGAITAMTLPMTRDLARYGIRCVTIAPSLFDSRMTSMMPDKVRSSLEKAMEFPRRAGKPEEFAELVRHIIENVMLNGTVLRLDGGMRMPSKM